MKKNTIGGMLATLGLTPETEITVSVITDIITFCFPKGFPLRKGWLMRLWMQEGEDGASFCAFNPCLSDKGVAEAYHVAENTTNEYGAPMLDEETVLGIPCADAEIDLPGKIVGVVVEDKDGKVVIGEDKKSMRFSWSNLFKQERQYAIKNGEMFVDNESVGFVQVLYKANKNRLIGQIAGVGPTRPETVVVKELEDVRLTKL